MSTNTLSAILLRCFVKPYVWPRLISAIVRWVNPASGSTWTGWDDLYLNATVTAHSGRVENTTTYTPPPAGATLPKEHYG